MKILYAGTHDGWYADIRGIFSEQAGQSCEWHQAMADDRLARVVGEVGPDLILFHDGDGSPSPQTAMAMMYREADPVPVLVVAPENNRLRYREWIDAGAREVAPADNPERLVHMLVHELDCRRLHRMSVLAGKERDELRAEKEGLEIRLASYRDRAEHFFQHSPDGIMIIDAETGKILRCNRTAARLLRYDAAVLEGIHFHEILASGRRQTAEKFYENLKSHGAVLETMAFSSADGCEMSFKLSAAAIPWGSGKAVKVALRDVREDTGEIKGVRFDGERLIRMDKLSSLGILIPGVAHEVNNPNQSILTSAELLQGAWKSIAPVLDEWSLENAGLVVCGMDYPVFREKAPALIDGILEGSRRIRHVIQKLRDFALQEGGNSDEPVNLNLVVDSALVLASNMLRKVTSRFSLHLQDPLPEIRGSFQGLEQVVINLLQNACLALDSREGEILLSTSSDESGEEVILTVEDEGAGIAEEDLSRISDPFFTTRRNYGHAGLGLSVADSIVKSHKGRIEIHSTAGIGTKVSVILPASRKRP